MARLGSGGTLLGTLIPAAILVALGIAYLVQPNHPAAPMTARHILPAWTGLGSIVLVVNSFFTYAGIEVNAVHVDELRNPAREYPKSIFLAMALVLAVFIGPTLAISWVIPSGQISFTTGVMQAFHSLFTHFGVGFAVPLIAIALAVGALAGMITWLGAFVPIEARLARHPLVPLGVVRRRSLAAANAVSLACRRNATTSSKKNRNYPQPVKHLKPAALTHTCAQQ